MDWPWQISGVGRKVAEAIHNYTSSVIWWIDGAREIAFPAVLINKVGNLSPFHAGHMDSQ